MEETQEQNEKQEGGDKKVKMGGGASNFRPWLFQPGKSGNPGGRPKGSKSLKTYAREYLEALPDEDKIEFMSGLPKDIVWRMAEGQPHQTNETDVKGVVKIEFSSEFDKAKEKEATPE